MNEIEQINTMETGTSAATTTAVTAVVAGEFATAATKSSAENKHLQQTPEQKKADTVEGTVTCIWQESPTVKCFQIRITDPQFSFKAGQWVDLFVPGLSEMSGYTMSSAPQQLEDERVLTLGVKHDLTNPALWLHTQCAVGSLVDIRAGGDFYLESSSPPHPVLLVGGGVGVNPLAAMFKHVAGNKRRSKSAMLLLYSARTEQELLYKSELDDLCKINDTGNSQQNFLCVRYFTTREPPSTKKTNMQFEHITKDVLAEALDDLCRNFSLVTRNAEKKDDSRVYQDAAATDYTLTISDKTESLDLENNSARNQLKTPRDLGSLCLEETCIIETLKIASDVESNVDAATNIIKDRVQVFICGPRGMISTVEQNLRLLGLTGRQIKYEKWW